MCISYVVTLCDTRKLFEFGWLGTFSSQIDENADFIDLEYDANLQI